MNKIKELIQDDKNFNKGTEFGNSLIEKSFRKFGAGRSILIDKNNRIIAGNKSVENAMSIGIEDVQIIESDGTKIIAVKRTDIDLDSQQGREMALADNASAKANIVFDAELIESEVGEAKAVEWGVELEKEQPEAEEDDFEVPEGGIETDIVLGDLFEIGEHRLLCGDSTDSDAVERLMDGKKADMVFTDPPYNVKINSIVNSGKRQHSEFKMASGEMNEKEFIDFLTSVFNNLVIFSKNGSIHYQCMDWKHMFEIISAGRNSYTELKNLCIWNKDNGGMGSFYRSKHELIFVFKNGTDKHINNFELGQNGRYRTNVWDYSGFNSFSNRERVGNKSIGHSDLDYHPTVKPVPLVADAILDCSNESNIISDVFGGSGTTMVASEKLKRKAYLIELDPKYCQVIVNRMIKLDPSLRIKRNGKDYENNR